MRKRMLVAAFAVFLSAAGRDASAEGAVFFVGGVNFGGNLNVLTDDGLDVEASIKNSPLFGLRVGSYGFPFGFEGTIAYTPSGLAGEAVEGLVTANTSILYTEANALLILLPGPVAPFVTAGGGLHYTSFELASLLTTSSSSFGWNVGGGVKVNAGRVALRFDIRDHVTTVGLDDLGLGGFGAILGLGQTDTRVHNVEVSFGVGIRF